MINASEAQVEQIIKHHLKYKVLKLKYSYDDEDNIGFISCYSMSGGHIQFQLRGDRPMFFSLIIDSVSYNVSYPSGELLALITDIGNKARSDFWDGASIIPNNVTSYKSTSTPKEVKTNKRKPFWKWLFGI